MIDTCSSCYFCQTAPPSVTGTTGRLYCQEDTAQADLSGPWPWPTTHPEGWCGQGRDKATLRSYLEAEVLPPSPEPTPTPAAPNWYVNDRPSHAVNGDFSIVTTDGALTAIYQLQNGTWQPQIELHPAA